MTSGYLPSTFGADLVAELASIALSVSWNAACEPEWATVQQEAGISAGSCHADAMAQ